MKDHEERDHDHDGWRNQHEGGSVTASARDTASEECCPIQDHQADRCCDKPGGGRRQNDQSK